MADSEKKQKTDPRDPRFRPFRIAMYALYLVVTVGFCVSLIYQVYRSTYAMTYGTVPHATATVTMRECVDGAEGLFKELELKRQQMGKPPEVTTADQRWLDYRREWIERFRELESRCDLNADGRVALKDLFKSLEKVADLYTTHAVQYAGHLGPKADELAGMFTEIRRSVNVGTP